MDMYAAELVIAPARNVPLSGARHGSHRVRPLVLAQSFSSGNPQPVVAAMPKFLVKMRFRERIRAIDCTNRNWNSDG
jgi:hypothetical protein